MTLFLFVGILAVGVIILCKGPIISLCPEDSRLGQMLTNTGWFRSYWLSGVFLFSMNAMLFCTSILLLFIRLPFIHLLIMLLAVIASIFLWATINKVWQGTRRNRLKMSAIGSSFYLLFSLVFSYMLVTLEPAYPGEDLFMKGIGLLVAIIVTMVAFVTCFVFTGFSKGRSDK
ncbi:hypothetical protein IEO70_14835 [Bacillus sp. AGMB 02131]|uniref:Uncharacterized protein n=1 Tax=Peribacillus faecalis TaxID=2772559 RepID=A0A927CXV9_9BACI|nr:hypothetical protein [Peribacillus faecalis]MBD3109621.1 hypothetical protein [Peribacillus faecalis]